MQVVLGRKDHTKGQIVQVCNVCAVTLAVAADESCSDAQVKEEIHCQNMCEIGREVPDSGLAQTTPARDDLFNPLLIEHHQCQSELEHGELFRAINDVVGQRLDFLECPRLTRLLPYPPKALFLCF